MTYLPSATLSAPLSPFVRTPLGKVDDDTRAQREARSVASLSSRRRRWFQFWIRGSDGRIARRGMHAMLATLGPWKRCPKSETPWSGGTSFGTHVRRGSWPW